MEARANHHAQGNVVESAHKRPRLQNTTDPQDQPHHAAMNTSNAASVEATANNPDDTPPVPKNKGRKGRGKGRPPGGHKGAEEKQVPKKNTGSAGNAVPLGSRASLGTGTGISQQETQPGGRRASLGTGTSKQVTQSDVSVTGIYATATAGILTNQQLHEHIGKSKYSANVVALVRSTTDTLQARRESLDKAKSLLGRGDGRGSSESDKAVQESLRFLGF